MQLPFYYFPLLPHNIKHFQLRKDVQNIISDGTLILTIKLLTLFIQIEHMIQPSARNSILEIYWWIQLRASNH